VLHASNHKKKLTQEHSRWKKHQMNIQYHKKKRTRGCSIVVIDADQGVFWMNGPAHDPLRFVPAYHERVNTHMSANYQYIEKPGEIKKATYDKWNKEIELVHELHELMKGNQGKQGGIIGMIGVGVGEKKRREKRKGWTFWTQNLCHAYGMRLADDALMLDMAGLPYWYTVTLSQTNHWAKSVVANKYSFWSLCEATITAAITAAVTTTAMSEGTHRIDTHRQHVDSTRKILRVKRREWENESLIIQKATASKEESMHTIMNNANITGGSRSG